MASRESPNAEVPGNAPQELKALVTKIFTRFFWNPHEGKFFGPTLLRNSRIVEVSSNGDINCPVDGREVVTITSRFEVTQDMCDSRRRMHGGCIAFLTDMLTSNVFLLTRRPVVSLNLNVVQHSPIPVGTTIHAVATAVNATDHVHDSRLKFYDAANGALLATGEHLEMRPSAGPQTAPDDMIIPPDSERISPTSRKRNVQHASDIAGTADLNIKQRVVETLRQEEGSESCFVDYVKDRLKVQEVGIMMEGGKTRTFMVCNVEVKQDMLNGMRTLHGGCGCYLVEECSSILLHALGGSWNGLNLNTSFHAPGLKGSTVKIVTTATSTGKRVSSLRTEILDSSSGRLLVSGTSTMLRDQAPHPPPVPSAARL